MVSALSGGRDLSTLFFLVSKLAWLLLRPETLLILALLLGLFLLRRGAVRWAFRVLAGAVAVLILITAMPVGALLLRPLETAYPVPKDPGAVTGILILGGAELTDESAFWGQPNVNEAGDRFLIGLALAERFPQARVVFTGGGAFLTGQVKEADLAQDILVGAGLDAGRLTLERRSRNTTENAVNTLAMLGGEAEGRWLLVTSAFHMPRAVETFCAAGWKGLVPYPTDFRTRGAVRLVNWKLPENLRDLNVGLKEWIGRVGYRATGRAVRPGDASGCLAD